jgi:hypothetical protein
MSIVRCYWCDRPRNTKSDEVVWLEDDAYCWNCFSNLTCAHCGGYGDDCGDFERVSRLAHVHPGCKSDYLKENSMGAP